MASGRDVRDMLGLPAGGETPTAATKKRAKPSGAVRKIRTSGASCPHFTCIEMPRKQEWKANNK